MCSHTYRHGNNNKPQHEQQFSFLHTTTGKKATTKNETDRFKSLDMHYKENDELFWGEAFFKLLTVDYIMVVLEEQPFTIIMNEDFVPTTTRERIE